MEVKFKIKFKQPKTFSRDKNVRLTFGFVECYQQKYTGPIFMENKNKI